MTTMMGSDRESFNYSEENNIFTTKTSNYRKSSLMITSPKLFHKYSISDQSDDSDSD